MNTQEHTPGPWHYQEESDIYTHIVRPDCNPGRIICSLANTSTKGEAEANARLIAALPELLAVLKETDEYLDSNKLNTVGSRSQLHRKMQLFLAKAEGR